MFLPKIRMKLARKKATMRAFSQPFFIPAF